MALEALNSQAMLISKPFKKAKRSNKRTRRDYSEDEFLAMCLVKLAHGGKVGDIFSAGSSSGSRTASPTVVEENKLISFPSHQALNGHKARHSHPRKPPSATVDDGEIIAPNPSGRLHQCSVCHNTFPTGQALGGHKRAHFEGVIGSSVVKNPMGDESAAAKSGTSDGGAVISAAPVMRDFDLNVTLYCDEELESDLKRLFD